MGSVSILDSQPDRINVVNFRIKAGLPGHEWRKASGDSFEPMRLRNWPTAKIKICMPEGSATDSHRCSKTNFTFQPRPDSAAATTSGPPGNQPGTDMNKMRAAQIKSAKAPFEIVERDLPQPGAGAVRIKIQACGVCHSDSVTKEGIFPNIKYPRVPGHEAVGVVDAVGAGVTAWKPGQRVGVGWNGGYCGQCEHCRRGNFFACESGWGVTGIAYDGGYADYMLASATALALLPDDLPAVEAAPLMCAGLTTFNALRRSDARAGELVAVLGLGGLGHLGVQYAAKMGFNTVAIARGPDKAPLARQLGARHYIDSQSQNPSAELARLGGAKIILATVTDADAMSATLGGLGVNGKLLVLGAPVKPLSVPAFNLIGGRRAVEGCYSGVSIDSQDTLAFSAQSGVRSMNEVYPLEKANEAYEHMMSGKARFRVVLTMGN
jgi:D-arabinose 1-dehydrogenase-like Zn-dependent alcohol dehydrogenase